MKQNRFLLISLLLAVTIAAAAQASTPRLVVWQKSGERVRYLLSDQPETTFEDGQLVIRTNNAVVSYRLENIVRYTYENANTATDILPNERTVSISQGDDAVTFSHLREGTAVGLYNASGVLLEQHRATASSPLTVSVSNRPGGVYIVKAGKETIKLMKP